MGCCISCHRSTKDTTRVVLRIRADVYTRLPLTDSTDPQQWKQLFHGLVVPVTLSCIQADGEGYVYRVSASGVDGSTFSARIRVPGTELHKLSSCFIQWEDEQDRERKEREEGGEGESSISCGLNFMSEEDAMKFLKIFPSVNIIDIHSNSYPSISKSLDHQYGCETRTGTEVLVEPETPNFDTAIQPYAHTSIPQAMKEEYTDGEPIISEEGEVRTHDSEIEEREGEDSTKSSAPQKQADERQASTVRLLTSRPKLQELLKFDTSSGSTVNIVQEIGTNYSALGPLLLKDDTGAVTEAIVSKHQRDAVAINQEILTKWLQGNANHPVNWSTLINVLKDIGLSELAEVIQDGFTITEISSPHISGSTAHSLIHEAHPSLRSQPQPDSEATSSVTPSSQVIEMTVSGVASSVPASDCNTNVSQELKASTEISSTEISGSEAHSLIDEAHPRARPQSQPESEATTSVTPSSQVIEMTGSSVASSVPASDCSTNVSHELTSTEISSPHISGLEAHSLIDETHPILRPQSQPESEAMASVTPSSQVIEMTGSSTSSSVPASDCSTQELTSTSPHISGSEAYSLIHEAHPNLRRQSQPVEGEATPGVTPPSQVRATNIPVPASNVVSREVGCSGSDRDRAQPQLESEATSSSTSSSKWSEEETSQQIDTEISDSCLPVASRDFEYLMEEYLMDEYQAKKSLCPICLEVVHNPYQVPCCGSNYCYVCLLNFKSKGPKCSQCLEESKSIIRCTICRNELCEDCMEKNVALENELKEYKVKCRYYEKGCKWVGLQQYSDKHEQEECRHVQNPEPTEERRDVVPVKRILHNFSDLKNDHVLEVPFYTHDGGYKMHLWVFPNGYGKEEGKYMSVFTCLVKGENDDKLEWPLCGSITVQLLDQSAKGNHLERTIHYTNHTRQCTNQYSDTDRPMNSTITCYNDTYSGQVTHSGRSEGVQTDKPFLTCEALRSKSCDYLQKGCLEFRISECKVQTSWRKNIGGFVTFLILCFILFIVLLVVFFKYIYT